MTPKKQKKNNPVKAAKWLWRFLTHDIWSYTNDDVRGIYRWLMNVFKSLFLSVRFFISDRIIEKASALTYYTLLALVPIVALLIGIANGFGLQSYIRMSLQSLMPGQQETIDYLFTFASNYLEHTKTGVVMGIGVVMLIYVIYSLIGNVETVFNQIWQQKKGRTTLRKITDYLSIMLLVPLFLVITSGSQILLQTYIKTDIYDYELSQTLIGVLRWAPYGLTIVAMTFIYIVIPNTKVKFMNAFVAAVIAGSAFMMFQGLFISGQIWVSKYNAIYGSFAALPLLLLWIQMAWVICLYGAELSYASQNVQNFNFEEDMQNISRQYNDFLTALVASAIFRSFSLQQPAPTTEEVCHSLQLPSKLVGSIISNLSERGIIRETVDVKRKNDQHTWIPGRDISTYSIASLFDELETFGITDFKYRYSQIYDREWSAIEQMRAAAYQSGSSLLLKDIEAKDIEK